MPVKNLFHKSQRFAFGSLAVTENDSEKLDGLITPKAIIQIMDTL